MKKNPYIKFNKEAEKKLKSEPKYVRIACQFLRHFLLSQDTDFITHHQFEISKEDIDPEGTDEFWHYMIKRIKKIKKKYN